MKKSTEKKSLRLSSETLRALDTVTMRDAAGGYIIVSVIKDTAYPYTCPISICGCLPGH